MWMAWWSLSIVRVWTNLIRRDKHPSCCTKPECREHALNISLKCRAELCDPGSWLVVHTSAVHLKMSSAAYKKSKWTHLYIRRGIELFIDLFPSCCLNAFELLLSKQQQHNPNSNRLENGTLAVIWHSSAMTTNFEVIVKIIVVMKMNGRRFLYWNIRNVLVEIKCSDYHHCRLQTASDLHALAGAFTLTNMNSKRRQPTATWLLTTPSLMIYLPLLNRGQHY